MQITPHQLGSHLQKSLHTLYTLYGDEPLQQMEAADAIRQRARAAGCDDRSVHVVQGAYFDWSEVTVAAAAQSLFYGRTLVEIRIPGGKPGKEGSVALQRLAEDAAARPDGALLLVILPYLDAATRKGAWFTALQTHGHTIAVDPIERAALPQWIAQRLARQQQHVSDGPRGQQALEFFADRVEGNLLAAHQEILKIGLLYPQGELSQADIARSVLDVARYDVFKLGEAILAGQHMRAMRMMDGLQAEGSAAVLVHWTLSEDIRNLYRARVALDTGQPLPLVLRQLRVWGEKEKLLAQVLPGLATAAAVRLLHAAHVVDGIVKGLHTDGWPVDPWAALRQFAMQTMQALHPVLRPASV